MDIITISKGPNRVGVSTSHLKMEIDPVSETLCFLVYRIPAMDKVQKPGTSEEMQRIFSNVVEDAFFYTDICHASNQRSLQYIKHEVMLLL
jgi:hypothetical protein